VPLAAPARGGARLLFRLSEGANRALASDADEAETSSVRCAFVIESGASSSSNGSERAVVVGTLVAPRIVECRSPPLPAPATARVLISLDGGASFERAPGTPLVVFDDEAARLIEVAPRAARADGRGAAFGAVGAAALTLTVTAAVPLVPDLACVFNASGALALSRAIVISRGVNESVLLCAVAPAPGGGAGAATVGLTATGAEMLRGALIPFA
jgi:hypothetical protein